MYYILGSARVNSTYIFSPNVNWEKKLEKKGGSFCPQINQWINEVR